MARKDAPDAWPFPVSGTAKRKTKETAPDPALISLNDAVEAGIERLRKPVWAGPYDHLKIDIIPSVTGKVMRALGPWVHLYAPFNKECNGRDPVDILWAIQGWSADEKCWLPYTGPAAGSDAYKAEVARYEGVLNRG